MKMQKFFCKDCQREFVLKVLEEGEAEKMGLRGGPVICKDCKSTNVIPA